MKHHRIPVVALVAATVLAPCFAQAAVIVGADYAGADLTPADGDYLQGTFTNVGTFSVPAGVTVLVDPGNSLSITADRVEVYGTIDGDGAGAGGGLGGSFGSPGSAGGTGGNPGGGGGGGVGSFDADPSGGGGGGHGGAGGDGAFNSGTVGAAGPSDGTPEPPTNAQGSGGGGAGGMTLPYSGTGGDGGSGGAEISIVSDIGVYGLSSLISADGFDGGGGIADPGLGASGGGGGSGGGILLVSNHLITAGEITADGGDGGDRVPGSASPDTSAAGGGGGGGGRIKLHGILSFCDSSLTSVAGGAAGISDNDIIAPAAAGAAGTVHTALSSLACCGNGALEGGEDCDDGNLTNGDCCSETCEADVAGTSCETGDSPCSTETCDGAGECIAEAAPVESGCLVSPLSKLQIKASDTAGKSKLSWSWSKGAAFDQAVLGDPLTTTTYALCIFDYEDGEPVVKSALDVPASNLAWTSKDPKGFQFKDTVGAPDGVTKVSLKTGDAGKSKVKLLAKGNAFVPPAPALGGYFNQDPKIMVQLVGSNGTCWTADYTPANTTDSDEDSFKAQVKD